MIRYGANVKADGIAALRVAVNTQSAQSVKLLLGMPELDEEIIAFHASDSPTFQYIKNRQDGVDAAFFAALQSGDKNAIKVVIQQLNNDIEIYYVPKKDEPRVLWDNPIHFMLRQHYKHVKDIEEGIKNIEDEKKREEFAERAAARIREQTTITAKTIPPFDRN